MRLRAAKSPKNFRLQRINQISLIHAAWREGQNVPSSSPNVTDLNIKQRGSYLHLQQSSITSSQNSDRLRFGLTMSSRDSDHLMFYHDSQSHLIYLLVTPHVENCSPCGFQTLQSSHILMLFFSAHWSLNGQTMSFRTPLTWLSLYQPSAAACR